MALKLIRMGRENHSLTAPDIPLHSWRRKCEAAVKRSEKTSKSSLIKCILRVYLDVLLDTLFKYEN